MQVYRSGAASVRIVRQGSHLVSITPGHRSPSVEPIVPAQCPPTVLTNEVRVDMCQILMLNAKWTIGGLSECVRWGLLALSTRRFDDKTGSLC
jgi:hypothetical protein